MKDPLFSGSFFLMLAVWPSSLIFVLSEGFVHLF